MLDFQLVPDSGPVLVNQIRSAGSFIVYVSVLLGALLFVGSVVARLLRFRGIGRWVGQRTLQVWRVFFPYSRAERRRREVAAEAVVAITPLIEDMRAENNQHHDSNRARLSGIELAVTSVRGELLHFNDRLEHVEAAVQATSSNGDESQRAKAQPKETP